MNKRTLWDHQKRMLDYTSKCLHPALFVEMRLGKTLVIIRSILSSFPKLHYGALIVAPYCVLDTWYDELLLEGFTKKDICLLDGDRNDRLAKLQKNKPVYLASKECHLVLPELGNCLWDAVVADESTFMKSPPGFNWSKKHGRRPNTARYFSESFRDSKVLRRFLSTGMPMPESELDIYSQLAFLDKAILNEKSYYSFRHKYFSQNGFNWKITNEGKNFLDTRLSQFCFQLSRRSVGLDKKKIYHRRLCTLPQKIERMYMKAKRSFIAELDGKVLDVTDYTIAQYQWFRKIAGGLFKGEILHEEKYKLLDELVNGELKNEPLIVTCQFIDEIHFLRNKLEKSGRESNVIYGDVDPALRTERIRDWKKQEFQILIAQHNCINFGLNLSYSDVMVHYSLPLDMLTWSQVNDRIVHLQKSNPILIISLLTRNTVDEDIYEGLQRKETKQEIIKRMFNA